MSRNVGLLTYQLPGAGGVSRARSAARVAQILSHPFCERVRATQHAPRDHFRLPDRRHGLLTLQRTQRGALWASGAAQAAQFVRIILRFCGELLGLRGGLTRLAKPDFFHPKRARARLQTSSSSPEMIEKNLTDNHNLE